MKKKTIIAFALILGAVLAYTFYQKFLSTGPSMSNRETELTINALELYEAFEGDETTANKKYLNKVLEVQGQVLDVKKSEAGKYYIALETMGFGVVKCTMEDSFDPEESELSGKTIIIKGECIGYLLDVQIGEAIIIE